jgi:hypothetical protein
MENIRRNHRRGLSVIVSSLLLISVAVACSALTYFWVTSLIGFQAARAQTEIRVEQVTWIDGKNFDVTVRDLGASSATLESVSISKSQSNSITELIQVNASISPGSVVGLRVTLSTTKLEDKIPYVVRVTTTTGFYYEITSLTGILH